VTTKNIGRTWATLIIVFSLFYVVSAFMMISMLLKNLGIQWLTGPLLVVLILASILLIAYVFQNPQILFESKAHQKRILLTKMCWEKLSQYPDGKLDIMEEEMHNYFHNTTFDVMRHNRVAKFGGQEQENDAAP
jgi:protein-S-isoprenylcysteine O-methyltransferase Ste14